MKGKDVGKVFVEFKFSDKPPVQTRSKPISLDQSKCGVLEVTAK
jgi:hypothetical protein